MAKSSHHFLVALGVALAILTGVCAADDVAFSDLSDRLSRIERRIELSPNAPRHAVRTVAFLSHERPADGEPRPMSHSCSAACRDCGACGDESRACACCEPCGEATACYENCQCSEGCCDCSCGYGGRQARPSDYYAEVQLLWLRTHMNEGAIGKLSEQYELSPRILLGYEDGSGLGGRIRYWHYGHQSPIVGSGDGIRFQFDVYDLEATQRFEWGKTDCVISGGLRWADLEVEYDDRLVHSDMPGLTFGADVRRVLCADCHRDWATICGARWSVLGGDWEGSSAGFIDTVRDDNITVQELYGGVEYSYHARRFEAYARLTIEVQNWHSDAAAQSAGTDSIGFVGPGLHFGISR